MQLWIEFEEKKTADAKFAGSIDRFQPMLANFLNDGSTWKENGVKFEQVFDKNSIIDQGSSILWSLGKSMLDEAKSKNMFAPE